MVILNCCGLRRVAEAELDDQYDEESQRVTSAELMSRLRAKNAAAAATTAVTGASRVPRPVYVNFHGSAGTLHSRSNFAISCTFLFVCQ